MDFARVFRLRRPDSPPVKPVDFHLCVAVSQQLPASHVVLLIDHVHQKAVSSEALCGGGMMAEPAAQPGKIILFVCVLVTQLCPTLCNPMDCSLPGSSVHEIIQTGILEWVAISSSRGSS